MVDVALTSICEPRGARFATSTVEPPSPTAMLVATVSCKASPPTCRTSPCPPSVRQERQSPRCGGLTLRDTIDVGDGDGAGSEAKRIGTTSFNETTDPRACSKSSSLALPFISEFWPSATWLLDCCDSRALRSTSPFGCHSRPSVSSATTYCACGVGAMARA